MIQNIEVKNYRCFEHFEADGLHQVNLLVGKNNAGKSTLLEAVYLLVKGTPDALLTPLSNREELMQRTRPYSRAFDAYNLFYGHSVGPESFFEISSESRPELYYGCGVSSDPESEDLLENIEEDANWEALEPILEIRSNPNMEPFTVDPNRGFSKARIDLQENRAANALYISTKGLNSGELANLWNEIFLTPAEKFVLSMMRLIADIDKIAFQSGARSNPKIFIKLTRSETRIPLSSMGDGLQRILSLACSIANSRNGYLCIDEIDTGLHYRALVNMWHLLLESAQKYNVQIFATTHSNDCIRAFTEALEISNNNQHGKLFRLQDEGKGVEAISYDAEELRFAVKHDVEIR